MDLRQTASVNRVHEQAVGEFDKGPVFVRFEYPTNQNNKNGPK